MEQATKIAPDSKDMILHVTWYQCTKFTIIMDAIKWKIERIFNEKINGVYFHPMQEKKKTTHFH